MVINETLNTNKINELYNKFDIPIKQTYEIHYKDSVTGVKYSSGFSPLENEDIDEACTRIQKMWILNPSTRNFLFEYYTEQPKATSLSKEQIMDIEELILNSNIDIVNKEFTLEKYGYGNKFHYAYALNKENYHEDNTFLHDEDVFTETQFYSTRSEALADLVLILWDKFKEDDKERIKEILLNECV